jgi:hypothetical protein
MRGQVQLVDVVLVTLTMVALLVTAPIYYKFIAMVSAEAGPFSSILLQLVLPLLFIGLIVSIGVSARRGLG